MGENRSDSTDSNGTVDFDTDGTSRATRNDNEGYDPSFDALDGTAGTGTSRGETGEGTSRRSALVDDEPEPRFTLPSNLDDFDPEVPKRQRKGKKSGDGNITTAACAAILSIVFKIGSVLLTGTRQLALTSDERRELGGNLHDALQNFPLTSPIIKVVNGFGPWAGLADGLSDAIHKRWVYIRDHRKVASPPPPMVGQRPMQFRPEQVIRQNGTERVQDVVQTPNLGGQAMENEEEG